LKETIGYISAPNYISFSIRAKDSLKVQNDPVMAYPIFRPLKFSINNLLKY